MEVYTDHVVVYSVSCPWCRKVCSQTEGSVKWGYSQVCVMKNDDEDALLGQESTGEPNMGGDGAALFSRNLKFWGLFCCLPWSEPTVAGASPGCDCKVLVWKGYFVYGSCCLNFTKIEYCSVFIITLEKQQNKAPPPHVGEGCDLSACVWTDPTSGEAAQAPTSLLWAPGNPLEMLIVESTLICINYANQPLRTAVV